MCVYSMMVERFQEWYPVTPGTIPTMPPPGWPLQIQPDREFLDKFKELLDKLDELDKKMGMVDCDPEKRNYIKELEKRVEELEKKKDVNV